MISDIPAEVIHRLLIDAELTSLPKYKTEWASFVGQMPDGDKTPDTAIAVYDTAGIVDGRIQRTGETIVHPGINIRVRAIGYSAARKKASELFNHLDSVKNQSVQLDNGTSYKVNAFTHTTDIVSLGEQETRNRHSFVLNGIVTIQIL